MRLRRWLLASACFVATANAGIINGDFQTGDLAGWTGYSTAGGTLGEGYPAIALFDVTGAGASYAAAFHAGRDSGTGYQGGGIYQSVVLPAGPIVLSLDWAEYQPSTVTENYSAGRIELIVDGSVIAIKPDEKIEASQILRGTLNAAAAISGAGAHEIRIQVTRPYTVSANSPLQYLDNMRMSSSGGGGSEVPEPASWLAVLCGVAVVAAGSRTTIRKS